MILLWINCQFDYFFMNSSRWLSHAYNPEYNCYMDITQYIIYWIVHWASQHIIRKASK